MREIFRDYSVAIKSQSIYTYRATLMFIYISYDLGAIRRKARISRLDEVRKVGQSVRLGSMGTRDTNASHQFFSLRLPLAAFSHSDPPPLPDINCLC